VAALKARFCDQLDGSFGWIVEELMERCSHALVVDGHVWVIDPVGADGVEERIRAAGKPAGVIQLLDRHNRDCAPLAARLGVPHHVVPVQPIGPFSLLPIRMRRGWREVALWWSQRRLLVCADALGTAAYYRGGGERLAVHPLLRLRPPRLSGIQPEVIFCGHGEGVFAGADEALREALSTSRRRLPRQLASALSAWVRRPS
jgi:glyoxylase-like metal-dependent hydrolase (beta-lactamase superfamily II)